MRLLAFVIAFWLPLTAYAAPLTIVTGQGVYAALAQRLVGDQAVVVSLLSQATQDPHSVEASPSVAKALAEADLIIANGLGYDDWLARLVPPAKQSSVILVSRVVGRQDGDNPHLWYDPLTMPLLANALSQTLSRRDPAHKADYEQRLLTTLAALSAVNERVALLSEKIAGKVITASEPVFTPMADALGLVMRHEKFQWAVMNETEPAPADVAAMETDLKRHAVRLLVVNRQTTSPAVTRLKAVADTARVPMLTVSESQPEGMSYESWMLDILQSLEQRLLTP